MSRPLPTHKTKERTRTEIPERVDVAIVGAGIGGLVAGAYLAQAGLRVAMFDAHYVAGGCATQFHRSSKGGDTYFFDVGLHYIGETGKDEYIGGILADLGVHQEFEELDPDGYDTLIFPDFTFRMPASRELYRERLLELFPEERRGIDRFMSFLRQAEYVRHLVSENDGNLPLTGPLRVLFRAPRIALGRWATLAQVLNGCTKDPKLRALMAAQQGDYGLPPGEASAVFHAGVMSHFWSGAYYPRGGGQAISDKLAAAVEAAGSTIHLRRPVASILMEDGRAVGVRTEAQRGVQHTVRADVVLSNADIKRTFLDLVGPQHLPKAWVKKAEGWEYAAGIFTTYLGVKADLRALGMGPTNYWQFDGYDFDGMYDVGRREGPRPVRGVYITSASLKDPTDHHHAPEGVHTVEVMSLAGGEPEAWNVAEHETEGWAYRRNQDYQELKAGLEQDQVDRFDKLFPGAADAVVFRESATPMSHTRYTRATAGTGYGLAMTPAQFDVRRPGARAPLPGLYLCGASTRNGMGILGAMLSGRSAARAIARDLKRPLRSRG